MVKTLIEAVMLVFVVMYVFLQNLRATLIPTIVVPVALLGTFAVMSAVGFSINVLSMFGLVLAIGLLVDDAIVVVENVERLIAEEGLSPVDATRKAMKQITGALVGITTVLIAVFIPMAFFSGSTGAIYRQFSVTIVAAMLLSVFLALTLTPALCATLLRRAHARQYPKRGVLGWFNRVLARGTDRYDSAVSRVIGKPMRYMVIYVLIAGVVALLFMKLPSSYLPDEDQGTIITSISAPAGTPAAQTLEVVKQVEAYYLGLPQVDKLITLTGFSFNGSGQNNALAFVRLKDWSKRRGTDSTAAALIQHANQHFAASRDAQIFALNPPAIQELGTQSGLDFELEDRMGQGHDKLMAARQQLIALAAGDSALSGMRAGGLDDTPQFHVDIDREKASALGLSIADVNDTLQTAFGSSYVNNYVDTGRIQKVYVQADAPYRMMPSDIGRWYVRSSTTSSSAAAQAAARVRRAARAPPRPAATTARWCRSPRSPPANGPSGRRRSSASTARWRWKSPRKPARTPAPARRWPPSMRSSRNCPRATASTGPGNRTRSAWPVRRRSICTRFRSSWCFCVSPACTKAGPFRSR